MDDIFASGIKHCTSKRQKQWPDLPCRLGSAVAVAVAVALLVAERGDMPGIAVGLAVLFVYTAQSQRGLCESSVHCPSSATDASNSKNVIVIYISNGCTVPLFLEPPERNSTADKVRD